MVLQLETFGTNYLQELFDNEKAIEQSTSTNIDEVTIYMIYIDEVTIYMIYEQIIWNQAIPRTGLDVPFSNINFEQQVGPCYEGPPS